MDKIANYSFAVPLSEVMDEDGARRLHYEILKAARELGLTAMQSGADAIGRPFITARFDLRSVFSYE